MGSHSVTCHPAEVTFPPLPQLIKAGTRFSDPRGMQGWVDLVTYRGCIPARRWSPIPALIGLNVEQLRSCDERRYHSAKPPTVYVLSCDETVDIQCMAVVWHTLTPMSKHRGHAVIIECAASLGDASRYDCIGFYYCRRVQVKIDWESINAKVDAEYKQERERPSAVSSQPRT